MSFKSKVLAGAASLALVGGVAVVGGLSASAATPSCGHRCVNLFSKKFSDFLTTKPPFVVDVYRQGANVGQPIIMFQSSNADPAEDFTAPSRVTSATSSPPGSCPPWWPSTTPMTWPSSTSTRRTA